MIKRLRIILTVLMSTILISCSLINRPKSKNSQINTAKNINGIEKKSWITRATIGMLEYFERKQNGDEDRHPAEKIWPPKK